MVVPLPPTIAQGEASDQLLRTLKPARYCTIGLWILVPIRLILDGPFNCLAILFSALCCTYMLMNDPGVINCLFDGIRFFGMISTTIHLAKLGFVVPMLLEISLFFSFVLQGVISWVAYKAFKQISASSSGGTSQPFLGGDPYAIGQPPAGPVSYQTTFGVPASAPATGAPTGGPVNQPSGGRVAAPGTGNSRGFVPFGGQGRQLGGD
ncbi:hypothetical protein FOZ60_009484 [Perkinsus olseni]|uniref:Uncharacterized protein n=1 Tax=Perkinsus olseni TaxID=32597 RepID=A0A7J6NHJ0_PEROL|nr:hypothetical protein FOZ60_009484 [Perkinsus olseni]